MSSELGNGLVLGMGNPLLDMSVVADQILLDKYKLEANMACLAEERHQSLYKELTDKYEVEYIAGGAVQNTLRVAQWLLQRPKTCVFMGCVGSDEYANILKQKAEENGVITKYQVTTAHPTGTCAVIITDDGRHRTLCANLAAANCFTPDHLQKTENRLAIEEAQFYYISGFFLTVSPDSILEVASYALEHDRLFMMNLSAPFICQFFKDPQMKLFPFVDILFGNETEALALSEAQGFGTTNIREITLKIAALPKQGLKRSRIAIITQGHDPVLLAKDGKITEYPVVPLPPEKIVDTNGAGDAFVGGFISQLIQGKSLEVCVHCGIYAASEIIQRSGCSFVGKPEFKESP